jgi:predicted Zn-dependent protease
MNAANLISMMKMEYKPSEKNLQTLQNLIAENPWFSIGQQLLAKEIQRLKKDDFEKYLNTAAIYSLNRNFLYDKLFDSFQVERDEIELQNVNIEDEPPHNEVETEEQTVFDYPVSDYFANQAIDVKETSEDIVDKFLASSQKISIEHKNEKYEDGKMPENTCTEPIGEDGFVTETLAKIYAEQGYISKAIDVYEKLSLQDSKKSAYFAALIENLKKRN